MIAPVSKWLKYRDPVELKPRRSLQAFLSPSIRPLTTSNEIGFNCANDFERGMKEVGRHIPGVPVKAGL